MSQAQKPTYEFVDPLPIEPVDPGTNLLVTGPALGGLRELVMHLLACKQSEGLLLLTTDSAAPETIGKYQTGCPYDPARMAVVDATQDGVEDEQRNVHAVGDPGDLTGMGIVFSSLYEQLYDAGITEVRTGLYTLSTLVMYAEEMQPLYRFLHTLTGRIKQADGLGVSAIDPEAQDERTFRSITQAFDGEVQLRERDGTPEMRVRGLDDQPEGWQSFDLTE
jgi:hypothetical protein